MKSKSKNPFTFIEALESRIAPATFMVSNASDTGSTADNLTLRGAINAANALPGADTITFNKSVFSSGSLQKIILTNGAINITGPLTIKGVGLDIVTIEGNGADRIFNITDGDNDVDSLVKIYDVTLTGGTTAGDGGAISSTESLIVERVAITDSIANGLGGGIALINAGAGPNLTIKSSFFYYNQGSNGGAVYASTETGSITLSKSSFVGNTGTSVGGGAYLIIESAATAAAKITVESCTFSDNRATAFGGGGLVVENAAAGGTGKISIKNTQFTKNFAGSEGGGLNVINGNVTVDKALFSDNSADSGGAIYVNSGVTSFLLKGSKVLANSATMAAGGGIQIANNLAIIDKTTISGNSSVTLGGGIDSTSASLTIKTSTISGNSTAGNGGGISGTGASKTLTITGTQILSNTDGGAASDFGGGIYFTGASTLTLTKATLSGNSGYAGGGIYLGASSSLIATGSTFESNRATDFNFGTAGGGAIYSTGSTLLNLKGNTFKSNSSGGDGGAITILNAGSSVIIESNKFLGNVGGDDGGAIHFGAMGGSGSITKNTFQYNSTANYGGAVSIAGAGIKVFSKNSIRDNVAGGGGGINVASMASGITLSNDTIINNIARLTGGGVRDLGVTTVTLGGSKITGNSAPTAPNLD